MSIEDIRRHHRRRRFAMKLQQKLDRALESFVRINFTEWRPDLDEAGRAKLNANVLNMIKRVRDGEPADFADVVRVSDEARAPADAMRAASEKAMEALAKELPVYAWVKAIPGAGALGLATIVAECGDLANYATPAKVWKRLGFAPYEGHAGSTWKRVTWRPRALTAEEWIANPFSGERYALMHQLALWLVNHQWRAAKKTASGEGEPTGPYGKVYAKRRADTLVSHPDWTPGHRRMDALRVAMKAFLADLHTEWHAINGVKHDKQLRGRARAGSRRPTTVLAASAEPRRHGQRAKPAGRQPARISDRGAKLGEYLLKPRPPA